MSPVTALASPFSAAARARVDPTALGGLLDADLLTLATAVTAAVRAANIASALIAGEIDRRSSSPDGLAQRLGHRTAIELVKVVTGSTGRDAAVAVRVGSLDPASPVATALVAGDLSVAGAHAITMGLGPATEGVTLESLDAAALSLVGEALDPDRLLSRARQVRDELDAAGIATREHERRARRSLTFRRLPDGMSRLTWDMDPETAAVVGEVYDRATSPRRGGPRFVDPTIAPLATAISADDRSTPQLASDVFAELLRQGSAADSTLLLGSGAPQVRVHVALSSLDQRAGHGVIEGQSEPVSVETVERLACAGGVTQILFADGRPLDVGREQRLYTPRQRVALAARDGGCRWPSCDRPPSWTEAHHVHHWKRDQGRTDVDDGLLLCRHHHLLLHNHGWEIRRQGSEFELIPPGEVDPGRCARPMPTKSRVVAA